MGSSASRTWADFCRQWLSKKRWTLEGLEVPKEDRMEALAILQQWFFFAMLEEFVGVKINKHEFVANRNCIICVSTVKLPTYFERWHHRVRATPLQKRGNARRLLIEYFLC